MANRKVISYKQFPAKLPTLHTVCGYLLADKFHASQLVWGILITLCILVWAACIYGKYSEDIVELDLK